MPEKGATVLVGMSGGVDSTLTAVLLKERGCTVIGVTMSLWDNDLPIEPSEDGIKKSCYSPDEHIDIASCKQFCQSQNIPHYTIDVRSAYKKEVLNYFKSEYRSGRTPNPCIKCNPTVKFGAMLEGVRNRGIAFDYFCTGHYAHVVRYKEHPEYGVFLAYPFDATKDQTYFLYRVPQTTLEKVRFPLGGMTKKEVFALARSKGLLAAERSESQDFIPPEYRNIVFSDMPAKIGHFIDVDGHVLGTHRGIEYYTIGQRRGLGISLGEPAYVTAIIPETNDVVIGKENDLQVHTLSADQWIWAGTSSYLSNGMPLGEKKLYAQVKIRLASPPADACISYEKDGVYTITFNTPVKAAAPGQSAVVYKDGIIIGGGIISHTTHE